jgi:ADP-ribose pyrophosphatase YjhB (NUDIX family)
MINYKFCPYCGKRSKKYKGYFKCTTCSKKVYINSLPTASAFILKDRKYLLSKRAIEPKKGLFDTVGGFLADGEHPEKGIVREFKEETGLIIKIIDLLGVYIDKYRYQEDLVNTLNFCYIAKIVKGKIKPQDDVASLHWLPIEKIPNNLAFNWIKLAIDDLQKWYAKTQKTKARH